MNPLPDTSHAVFSQAAAMRQIGTFSVDAANVRSGSKSTNGVAAIVARRHSFPTIERILDEFKARGMQVPPPVAAKRHRFS
jgi:hypothetical protein